MVVRTHTSRHPAGLDLIPLERPDARISFPGGGPAMMNKFIHAIDGFKDGCTLSGIVASGEDPQTSTFSAMLLDFRRARPCVASLSITSNPGNVLGTMLWPLRAGRSPKVFANLLHEDGQQHGGGTINMVDFRYTSLKGCESFRLPDPVDDFRCFGDSIYAACTQVTPSGQRVQVHRYRPGFGEAQKLCTVAEAYDANGRSSIEDLKVLGVGQAGLAVSLGEHLALGRVAEPRRPIWRLRGTLEQA